MTAKGIASTTDSTFSAAEVPTTQMKPTESAISSKTETPSPLSALTNQDSIVLSLMCECPSTPSYAQKTRPYWLLPHHHHQKKASPTLSKTPTSPVPCQLRSSPLPSIPINSNSIILLYFHIVVRDQTSLVYFISAIFNLCYTRSILSLL